jgi:large subunit ribosomal protein L9
MKIILKENIENLGKRGDIINVAVGYGRNYLIPRKLALQVTPSNMKMIEMEQKALQKKLEGEVKSFKSVVDQLNQTSLSFERKSGDKDVIFGSVSISDIKEALDKLGIEVEKKKILLAEPIKRLGNFTVPIKVFHDEQTEIKIEVKKEGAEVEETKPAMSEEKAVGEKEAVKPEDEQEESLVEPELEKKEDPVLKEAKEEVTVEEKEDISETTPEIPDEKKEELEEKQEAVIETKPEESREDNVNQEEKKD